MVEGRVPRVGLERGLRREGGGVSGGRYTQGVNEKEGGEKKGGCVGGWKGAGKAQIGGREGVEVEGRELGSEGHVKDFGINGK